MTRNDFSNILFVTSFTTTGAAAYLTVHGRDCVDFEITVEFELCDAMSFGNEHYDNDSGVYQPGYLVTIYGEDPIEAEHQCAFRTLSDAEDYIISCTIPEGFISTKYEW